MTWRWVDLRVVLALHDEQLAEHGGGGGLRDAGLLDSALARPRNLEAHAGAADAPALAAAYAFGIARSHPFVDGNKRTAAVTMELFLLDNGYALDRDDAELVTAFVALAAGDLDEPALAEWIRQRLRPAPE